MRLKKKTARTNQLDLFYVRRYSSFLPPSTRGMVRANSPATSREAAQAVAYKTNEIQAAVLSWFRRVRNGTDCELEDSLGAEYPGFSTLRKRRGELVQKGYLRDSGATRVNRRGRHMIVWEVAP